MAAERWVPPNPDHPPPKAGEPDLHRAARLGDHGAIRALVAGGADIDEPFDVGLDPGARVSMVTPLGQAAGSGDGASGDTLRLLLELGASLEPAPGGFPAIWYACNGLGWNHPPGGDADRVAVLLEAGQDPNWARPPRRPGTSPGVTVLVGAAGSGDPARVKLLLDAGAEAEPAGTTSSLERPLQRGVESGSTELVQRLLSAGASVNRRISSHDLPLLGVARSVAMLQVLLDWGAVLDPPGEQHQDRRVEDAAQVLAAIAGNGQIERVERLAMLRLLLAECDIAPAQRAEALYSSAFVASARGVEALLSIGVDPHSAPRLLSAVCFDRVTEPEPEVERVVELLVGAGLDPNDEDDLGYRPLHTALSSDTFGPGYQESDGFNEPAALALIRLGASVDIVFPQTDIEPLEGPDQSGFTAVHAAALHGSATVVEALLDRGADPARRTPADLTALDLARSTLALRVSPTASRPEVLDDGASPAARRRSAREAARHERSIAEAERCVSILEQAGPAG